MADESDGISEAFEGQLRVAVTAAGRVGEIIARHREEAARRAQAESQQQARELTSRFQAERQAARVELSGVYRNDWWDRATPEQIGTTLATARAWGNEDPEAVRAESRMRDELRTRYGVDADQAGGDPQAVQAAIDAELLRRQAETERQRGTGEEAEAALLMREADRVDRQADAADQRAENAPEGSEERTQAREVAQSHERTAKSVRAEAGPKYDSAERREADANKLEARGIDKEAVSAKMSADVGNAKPATKAVKGAPATATKAKPARSTAPRVQRSELER
ncbi:hypothetical protein [Microbacterium aurantiacum]|uniref:Colicin import membrane protein n=1 Tax=Microbacterium aurantiacum TaxID=162393 RepID=A0A0M8MED3_9MICO|nr:hypothetical protein [Microbacterium chocolatum]ANG86345.1 hypothetical protein A8L33_14160 [Microbacterium chocolatum]KOS10756.1 hypothetical protein XI38_07990 [Microbacterium chocolatum]